MPNYLAIDVGNSRTKFAAFYNDELVESGELKEWSDTSLRKLIENMQAAYVILSTVKHLNDWVTALFDSNQNYLILSQDVELPFVNTYKTPETLGNDRIAAVAGAQALYPRQNSLIIDAGTCITYDLLKDGQVYLGGNISPGLHMRLEAMHKLTNRLPQVGISHRSLDIGTDTLSAMQVGAQSGAIYEMEGFIEKYKKILENLNILLTGGDLSFFVKRLKTRIFAAPNLVLQGLYEILKYNVQNND